MKLNHLLLTMLSLLTMGLSACGNSGGAGLNGSLTVTAAATGSVVNATATYLLPTQSNSTQTTQTNLSGVLVDFSVQVGTQTLSLGSASTNSLGIANFAFIPLAFSGSQTITVIARTGNLAAFSPLTMIGSSLTVTPPQNLAITTSQSGGTALPTVIAPSANFVVITDPFGTDLSGHQIDISDSFVSGNGADTLVLSTATATTGSAGTATFPGATATLFVPTTVGGTDTMTVTWTVTDALTGQTGTGVTTITLTKTS